MSHYSTRETPDLPHRTPSRVEPFPPANPTMCPHQLHERWFVAEPDQQPADDVAGGNFSGSQRQRALSARWMTAAPRHPFHNA